MQKKENLIVFPLRKTFFNLKNFKISLGAKIKYVISVVISFYK